MTFYADLHVHSKYSRATSRDLDLEHLAMAAARKGVRVLGTGDFTHPAWRQELRQKLEPAEPGLFRLRSDIGRVLEAQAPGVSDVRFLLQVELSTIYKKDGRVRKVHHLVYVPDWESAERLCAALARIGNLAADGRPILGLDSRDLLELVLTSGEGSYLIPAHIWTPWFSVFGSQSGFDRLEEAYGELTAHIFALETGLSSDPPMNWRWSALDGYRLVSNSDAHSPGKVGREACRFETELDYFAIRRALQTGQGHGGTVEFFPEEGKYHLDGHRACGVRLEPTQTRALEGRCPACGRPLTIGVLHRVEELADRTRPEPPPGAARFESLVPLEEVLAELLDSAPASRAVQRSYERLLRALGPELVILREAPLEDVRRIGPPLLDEALNRMRNGRVLREPGFDGQYGVIRLFRPEERAQLQGGVLFAFSKPTERLPGPVARPQKDASEAQPESQEPEAQVSELDPEQARILSASCRALLVEAGPGTGKTRLLTHWIARLIQTEGIAAEACVAITFTRRAAEELRRRLSAILEDGHRVTTTTFHGLALIVLDRFAEHAGLKRPIRVATEAERLQAAVEVFRENQVRARIRLRKAARADVLRWRARLWEQGLLDVEELLERAIRLLETDSAVRACVQATYWAVAVDEYQDLDPEQYRFLRALVGPKTRLLAIGDPDQAIYGFRGGDVRFFAQFLQDFPGALSAELGRNYRNSAPILACALQVVAPVSLRPRRVLQAVRGSGPPVWIRGFPNETAEAAWVAREIERRVGGVRLEAVPQAEKMPAAQESFGDFAVLYRTEAQAEPLEEALARAGIPYQKRTHRPVAEHPVVRALMDALGAAGGPLLQRLCDLEQTLPVDPERMLWLERLKQLARERGEEDFWNALALSTEVDFWDRRADRVSLLTLHAAKGLEFRTVFLIGCEEGLLPLRFGSDEPASAEAEERRLFFVGLTRARDQVLISYAHSRLHRGQRIRTGPSSFLRELPAEHARWERFETRPGELGGRQLKLF
ncbi:MAG: UvrD-helicase domain-containing protein [Bacteroidota bacterium]|nr:UvrD-helicase domain-containing protein [Rhodothermia bacterium]MCS7156041.1 UvrD-helicase domain-containing protein [Bacteroidota bacterium]MDW8137858.1 UvrD-helicase domain-containing protein [Bacteroidota bacterium]MDW8286291.1 UvrD-helicase domain-containing protein [Bacteroidota bacterium]